ncbi:MAG: LysM peptidoglycan-binding domain-containing protein [Gammaproteobacteria bacterium]|nr:LysM peptidoglycan-binding domain-containing protein [Gammaproteobacteria bacterium]
MGDVLSPDGAITTQTARAPISEPAPVVQQAPPVAAEISHDVLATPIVIEVPAPQQVHRVSVSTSRQHSALPRVIKHVVKPGDTLWDLAKHYTQEPFRYSELAERSQIQNPDLIYPGQIVHIELVPAGSAL